MQFIFCILNATNNVCVNLVLLWKLCLQPWTLLFALNIYVYMSQSWLQLQKLHGIVCMHVLLHVSVCMCACVPMCLWLSTFSISISKFQPYLNKNQRRRCSNELKKTVTNSTRLQTSIHRHQCRHSFHCLFFLVFAESQTFLFLALSSEILLFKHPFSWN